nr:uncharacterized protein LOC112993111 [Dromaius novaehollandiae]
MSKTGCREKTCLVKGERGLWWSTGVLFGNNFPVYRMLWSVTQKFRQLPCCYSSEMDVSPSTCETRSLMKKREANSCVLHFLSFWPSLGLCHHHHLPLEMSCSGRLNRNMQIKGQKPSYEEMTYLAQPWQKALVSQEMSVSPGAMAGSCAEPNPERCPSPGTAAAPHACIRCSLQGPRAPGLPCVQPWAGAAGSGSLLPSWHRAAGQEHEENRSMEAPPARCPSAGARGGPPRRGEGRCPARLPAAPPRPSVPTPKAKLVVASNPDLPQQTAGFGRAGRCRCWCWRLGSAPCSVGRGAKSSCRPEHSAPNHLRSKALRRQRQTHGHLCYQSDPFLLNLGAALNA